MKTDEAVPSASSSGRQEDPFRFVELAWVSSSYPAQQESCVTSFVKVCAASFSPSTIVR